MTNVFFNSRTPVSQPCGLGIKTPILRGQNYGSFGSKVWHFWVLNHMVLDGKCVLWGGWFRRVDSDTSPSRLGGVAESTPIPSTSRLGGAFESSRRSVRVDSKLQGLQAVGNKKGADSTESTPDTTMKRLSKKKNVNPLNRHRNCCHHHH